MVFFLYGKLQNYLAHVQDARFFQRLRVRGVQQSAGVRPKRFDVTVIVQPVDPTNIPPAVDQFLAFLNSDSIKTCHVSKSDMYV